MDGGTWETGNRSTEGWASRFGLQIREPNRGAVGVLLAGCLERTLKRAPHLTPGFTTKVINKFTTKFTLEFPRQVNAKTFGADVRCYSV